MGKPNFPSEKRAEGSGSLENRRRIMDEMLIM